MLSSHCKLCLMILRIHEYNQYITLKDLLVI